MKISINNFKSIKVLNDFEIKPITILSGVNSTGKSSFIQFLLLLKQTIDLNSSNHSLFLKGDLYEVKEYKDILKDKRYENKLGVKFEFDKTEDVKFNSPNRIQIFDSFNNYKLRVEVKFDSYGGKEFINEFILKYTLPEGDIKEQFIKFNSKREIKNEDSIEASSNLFGDELWGDEPVKVDNINYSGIFPINFETIKISSNPELQSQPQKIKSKHSPSIDGVRELIESTFKSISYIGPLRDDPKDEYPIKGLHENVGVRGEFVAQVLQNYAEEEIEFYKPTLSNSSIQYKLEKDQLLQAVKYWICDIFQLGKEIKATKFEDTYHIHLVQNSGLEITIKHVGFGISQILPIIVEGLRMPTNGTLILEQPEIHLHPKIQSLLFDFLYSLILIGKSVIIETHSDHFITRMRRRIAEDVSDSISDKINLTFIETNKEEILFRKMDLDDYGAFNYFPTDFIELSGTELKAIVSAQMKKRAKKSE